MNDPDHAWRKLVAAARQAPPPATENQPAPAGLAGRIVALRQSIVALARVWFWRRWSVAVAIASFGLLAAVFVVHRCTDARPPLLDAPDPLQPTP